MEERYHSIPFQDPGRTSYSSREIPPFDDPRYHHDYATGHTNGSSSHQYATVQSNTTYSRESREIGNRSHGSWFTWWRLELFMSFLSVAFLAAIVGILIGFHGRPLSAWPYDRFSLNSVIALLATGARASLMFAVASCIGQRKWRWFLPKNYSHGGRATTDDAPERTFRDFEAFDDSSRGWYGSLKFIGKIGLRDLAFIGAAITVLALLFNTIVQNLVVTNLRMKPGATSNERAGAVPRSTTYDRSSAASSTTDRSPDLSTLAAMYTGMLSSNVSDLPVACSTGNCTFPVIPSLGVCGECMDVTSTLVHSCSNSTNSSSCSWTIPGGATLQNPDLAIVDTVNSATVFKVDAGPNLLGPASILNASDTTNLAGHPVTILDFNVIGLSNQSWYHASATTDGFYNLHPAYNLPDVKAYECALWFCLQARHTNVSFGVTNQGVAATWDQATTPVNRYTNSNFTNIPASFNVEPGVVYGVSVNAQQAATLGIQDALYGTVNPDNAAEITYTGPTGTGSLDGIKGLWYGADDMNGWIGNLTQSLSNNVRLTGTTTQLNSTLYNGIAWTEEAYIKVQWLWLIYPCALVLISIGFLLITIVENRKQKPWKNSSSAILYTRLDNELEEVAAKADAQNRGLTEDFDRTAVRLNIDDWTLHPITVR